MAAVPQKTLNWLWDVLRREYRDPQRAYSDLAQAIATYPGLAPRTDVYTSENGVPALLLHLNGTLPVNFRGNQYRFPIAIWVPLAYPYEAPILYVTPTDDIVIRPGQHVSGSDGRIYHPYLARWREAWERSTIADFLKLLVDVFAREPPVMSKQQSVAHPPPPTSAQPPPSRPPHPTEQRPPARPPSITSNAPPPPPPPKANDQSNTMQQPSASPAPPRPSRYDAPPPLPGQSAPPRPQSMTSPPPSLSYPPNQYQAQYPPQRPDQFRQGYPQQQQPPQGPAPVPQRQSVVGIPTPASNQPPQGPPQNQYQHPEQYRPPPQNAPPPPQQGQYAQQLPYHGHGQPMQPPPQQHQQQPYLPPQQPAPQAPKPRPQQPNLMDDSPFDISLPTTNADLPTPAIPPNPEKQQILQTLSTTLLATLHNQISQSSAALSPLQSQYSALQSAEQTLQSELAQLKTLQGQLSQNVDSLNNTIKAADRTISSGASSSSANKIPSVDELIIPPTVVARQLYDAVAEQRGYEAAIYALTEGFVRGRIGSELWARKTRECAREDFRRKYLIKRRLGTGMGLDTSQT